MKEIEEALAAMPINQEMPNPAPSAGTPPPKEQVNAEAVFEQPTLAPQQQARLGPKYLEALDKVTSLADVHSVTVQLPITMNKVTVSSLTGLEEQTIRTKSSDPETFMAAINKMLFDHAIYTTNQPMDYNEFLKGLYPHDKTLLTWALMASTYDKLPEMEKICEKCGERFELQLTPGDLLKADGLPETWSEELPPEDFVIRSSILDGAISFEIGLPNEERRMQIASLFTAEQMKQNLQQNGAILSYADNLTYFIKRIIVKDPAGDIILTHPINDIYPFMTNLPPKVKDMLSGKANIEYFDKYMADFYDNVSCKHCNHQNKVEIIPEVEFFRKALSVY